MGGGKRSKNKRGNNKSEVQTVDNFAIKEDHKKGKGESSKENSKTADEIEESIKVEDSPNAAASPDDGKEQTISRRQKKNRKKTAGATEETGATGKQANVLDLSVSQSSTNADFKESTNEDIPSSNETDDVKIERGDDNDEVANQTNESFECSDWSNTEAESRSNLGVNTTTDFTDSDWNSSASKIEHVPTNPYESNSTRNSGNPYGANEHRKTSKEKTEWNKGSPMENRRSSNDNHWDNKGSYRNNDESWDYSSGNSGRSYGGSGNRNYGRYSDNFDNRRNSNYNNSRRSDGQSSRRDSDFNTNQGDGSWRLKDRKRSSERKSGQFQDEYNESKRTPDTDSKRSRSHNRNDYGFSPNTNRNYGSSGDKEFDEFMRVCKKYSGDAFVKVKEIQEDLFKMPEEYALAHCVAEDMSMGSGIAVQFSQQFKSRDELYQQRQKQGGLAILTVGQSKERFIYYLVTKKLSNGKPTMHTMWSSLRKLQQHMEENKVQKLAIPRIGCGLDRLEWSDVKAMIEYVFRNTDVDITVCNFQQPEGDLGTSPPKSRKCPVKNVSYSLTDIEGGTAIIYLGTEDGHVSEETENLDKKFNFVKDYKMERKQVGKVLQMYKQNKNYCLYGFIIAKSKGDPFSFVDFQKCVVELRKLNKDFYYVAIEAFLNEDELIMSKIVNLLRSSLYEVEVYVCWSGRMQAFMPMPVERRDDRF